MKIENIKINSFGTLKNKEINLDKNVNIIYGKNESGKSTLLTYIKKHFMEYQRIKMVNKYQILTNINHGVERRIFWEN